MPSRARSLRRRKPAFATVADAGAGTAADAVDEPPVVDSGVATATMRAPAAGEIVITEVLANPVGQDTGREWIEIASQSVEPLSLTDLHVADGSVDVAVPAGIIGPTARIVLGQSMDPSQNGGAPIAIAYGAQRALNNDGEEVRLCIGPCAGGTIVDRVGWKSLGAAYDGRALVFDHVTSRTCAATQPFGTAGDFGTPGELDSACPVPDGGF